MRKLTHKQVLALSKALQKRHRKLPKVGFCVTLRGSPGQGAKHVEVCHFYESAWRDERRHRSVGTVKYRHNYYVIGGKHRSR